MIPISLSLSWFKGFKESQTFVFPSTPGLWLLTGKNKKNPELTSNACGKSSLLDAWCWCCYGRTARGLSAGNVKTWKVKKTARVSFSFRRSSIRYRLTRTQSPNSLTLRTDGGEPVVVTQDVVDGIIGYGYDQFLSTCLIGQFGTTFFDLGPTEKLKVFSRILNLEFWEDAAKRAAELERAATSEADALRLALNTATTQLSMLREQLVDEKGKSEEFDGWKRHRISKAKEKLQEAERARVKAEDVFKNAPKVKDYSESYRETLRFADKADNKNRALWRAIEGLKGGEKCPTCGTILKDADHLKKEIERLREERAEAQKEWGWVHAEAERLSVLCAKQDGKKRDLERLQRELEGAERAAENLERDVTRIRNEKNVHEENIKVIRGKISKAKEEAGTAKDRLAVQMERASSFAYWKKELGNLRLWLVSESLTQLSLEVNGVLFMLGLRGWRISFDVEKVTKAGNISRGFSTLVHPPNGEEKIDWRAFSGSETSRLRIAGAIGLSSLIRARMGISTPLEVWDEPLSWISSGGLDDCVAFFKDRAVSEKRSIILIAHGVSSSGDFDGVIRINKEKDRGSVIQRV